MSEGAGESRPGAAFSGTMAHQRARRCSATCHATRGAAHVMKQVVLLSALLEPAAAVSVPPVIFLAGRRVARRAPHPALLSDTWPTDPPWRGREALKAFPKSAKNRADAST